MKTERPRSFTLYFEGGSEVLMPASSAEIEAIKRELASRQASEVMIIGHTDSLGSLEVNDKLSLKRAVAACAGNWIWNGCGAIT